MQREGGTEGPGRADVPRLIEWTGERMVPWAPDVQVVYEHLHRYLLAAGVADGRRLLDLGCGEGYGAALLAEVAGQVVGVDVDEATVEHARARYARDGLSFEVGTATDLSRWPDDSFDLVVCFEVLEHLEAQDEVMAEVRRVLAPEGLVIASTPDRDVYRAAGQDANPFHVRELSRSEFDALLRSHFAHVRQLGQRAVAGSLISGAGEAFGGGARTEELFATREGDAWRRVEPPLPTYAIALAGEAPLPDLPDGSLLADADLTLVRDPERAAADATTRQDEQVRHARERVAELELRLATAEHLATTAQRLADAHERWATAADGSAALRDRREHALLETSEARREEVAVLRRMIGEANTAVAAVKGTNAYLWGEIEIAHRRLRGIEASVTYRALERARSRLSSHGGALAARVVRAGVRRLGGPTAGAVPAGGTGEAAEEHEDVVPTLHFPAHREPRASIVIPAFEQPEVTLRCLEAVHAGIEGIPYEVIVVDDASGPELQRALATVSGIRVVRNERNQHFLRSANRGAAAARGEYVVFLNNDTEPDPGWLRALVETADEDPSIGAVGAKLLLPDRRVQEAGAIVWRDGSAHHVGRLEHPDEARLNYVRDVDYCSAACLLVRADAVRRLGAAFDERFAPAYYEDVDLCFGIRDLGLRVVYQPHAVVVHHEGTSHGTDVEVGVKAKQVTNQAVFAAKWAAVLRAYPAAAPEDEHRHQDRRGGPRVLVVDHQVPAMHEDAGSMRMHYMLRALVDAGCRVTFLPDNRDPRQPATDELQQLGVEVLYGAFHDRLVLASMGDDLALAILSRPTVAWRYLYLVREFNRLAHVAYDTVDLHYLREERRAVVNDSATVRRVSQVFLEMERGLVRTCDETIAVSQAEAAAIEELVPGTPVAVLPTLHPVATHVRPAAGRHGLLFVGGFDHQPNVEGAIALVREVLPRVQERLGEVPVWIVGSRPPKSVRVLEEVPGVQVLGFVPEIEPYFERARALVAPLTYGAGVKGKITQSMALGLPVVTTSVGVEGLEAEEDVDLLVADDADGLAERVVACYDDDRWTALSDAGLALARRRFSPEVAGDVLEDLLRRAGGRASGTPALGPAGHVGRPRVP